MPRYLGQTPPSERILHRLGRRLFGLFSELRRTRVVIDRELRLGARRGQVAYDISVCKEEAARDFVFSRPGEDLTFLDVGARDGRLDYLFGIRRNLRFDPDFYQQNLERFRAKYSYWGLDINPDRPNERVIVGDVASDSLLAQYPNYEGFFDVAYSNNVFEHLRRPWVAAGNILALLKSGGICITIAPFALRYHESPEDHYRYTHTGLSALFEEHAPVKTLLSGYDITGRRNDWQGSGEHRDICPVDRFGAWRENWFVINVVEKPR